MNKDDGGPAFPRATGLIGTHVATPDYRIETAGGMSLRDWFALQAMALCISLCLTRDGCTDFVAAAHAAYEYADEMLAQRSKS